MFDVDVTGTGEGDFLGEEYAGRSGADRMAREIDQHSDGVSGKQSMAWAADIKEETTGGTKEESRSIHYGRGGNGIQFGRVKRVAGV